MKVWASSRSDVSRIMSTMLLLLSNLYLQSQYVVILEEKNPGKKKLIINQWTWVPVYIDNKRCKANISKRQTTKKRTTEPYQLRPESMDGSTILSLTNQTVATMSWDHPQFQKLDGSNCQLQDLPILSSSGVPWWVLYLLAVISRVTGLVSPSNHLAARASHIRSGLLGAAARDLQRCRSVVFFMAMRKPARSMKIDTYRSVSFLARDIDGFAKIDVLVVHWFAGFGIASDNTDHRRVKFGRLDG